MWHLPAPEDSRKKWEDELETNRETEVRGKWVHEESWGKSPLSLSSLQWGHHFFLATPPPPTNTHTHSLPSLEGIIRGVKDIMHKESKQNSKIRAHWNLFCLSCLPLINTLLCSLHSSNFSHTSSPHSSDHLHHKISWIYALVRNWEGRAFLSCKADSCHSHPLPCPCPVNPAPL